MAQSAYTPKAQEARNKAVVQRYFGEVLDQKKIELMPELVARDVVLHRPGFDVTGLDAAMQRLRVVLQDYTAFSSELSGLIAEGDMVSVRVFHRVRARPHTFRSRAGEVRISAEQDLNWAAIVQFRLKDGKIAEEWVMRDELGMLAQMGKITIGV
jgi:predicted SnoaL-like aldol condensation-catalyzing enzyme